ncbi:MAG: DUF4190 domain-containing protein [Phycisphaerales bacterium]|nr:DUF4190 domain-containing protein [Phycisphaerales bacterium]
MSKNPYQQDVPFEPWQPDAAPLDAVQGPPRTSKLAIASVVCSLIFCCPIVLQVIGIFLGIVAFLTIGASRGRRKGKGIAAAGIILGLLITIGWCLVIWFGWLVMRGMYETGGQFIQAAMSGDVAGARQVLSPNVRANVTDEQIIAFGQELNGEYGDYYSCGIDLTDQARQRAGLAMFGQQPGTQVVLTPAMVQFSQGTGYAVLEMEPDQSGGLAMTISGVVFYTDDGNEIRFPPTGSN